MSIKNEICIQRCFDLARLGTGRVSPNPIVGALIVSHEEVLGEGFYKEYGNSHAEVIAIQSSIKKNIENFQNSTIYVSLEPCNIYGKTPPCSQLIMNHKIPKVVVSSIDKTEGVNFSGIQVLKDNGHEVRHGVLKRKGNFIARIRNTFVSRKRPYIILKFAQSADGFMSKRGQQTWLSNAYSKRLVHKWRTEVQSIMVGTNTVLIDNPKLTARQYQGKSPLRISIDLQSKIPETAFIKDGTVPTWIYTKKTTQQKKTSNLEYKSILHNKDLIPQVLNDLYDAKRNTLLVEGGSSLLNSFIEAGLWDEVRIIKSPKILHDGLEAPRLKGVQIGNFKLYNDEITLLLSPNNVIYS